ncbi:MAG: hypothetical protein QM729_07350 [Solirubrobacterales bacterium]
MPNDAEGIEARFREIDAIDPARSFGPFTEEELETLRAFSRVCGQLNSRALLTEGVRFSFEAGVAGAGQRIEHAGDDALRSAMMDFRLIWMSDEPTYFPRLRNKVRARIDLALPQGVEAQAAIDLLGREFGEARREKALGFRVAEGPEGIRWHTAEEVIDDWISGVAFHGDRDRAARVGAWEQSSYEIQLIKAVNRISNVWFAFEVLVRAILDGQADAASDATRARSS